MPLAYWEKWDLMARQPDGTAAVYDGRLVDDVVKKADGIFVWVRIIVSQLALAIEIVTKGKSII